MRRDVIAIGASAGGVEPLRELVAALPGNLAAAVLVTLHVAPHGRSILPELLEKVGLLPAQHAREGMPLRRGHIYVAPPDRHLVVVDGMVSLSRGPRENGSRPAIDAMFRSAARAYGARVVGVVLSGTLDDGVAGLGVIKARGGATIAQSPCTAVYPDMPRNAIEAGVVEAVLPLEEMALHLMGLVGTAIAAPGEALPNPWGRREATEGEGAPSEEQLGLEGVRAPDPPNTFSCPDCGGVLQLVEEPLGEHYRCMVGHGWSSQALLAAQLEHIEESLWAALRALADHRKLTVRLLADARSRGSLLTRRYEDKLRDIEINSGRIRSLLLHRGRLESPATEIEEE